MKTLLLHLSDIHIKSSEDEILRKSDSIAKSIFSDCHGVDHVFILVTGDVAYSGAASEYNNALSFFEEIKDKIIKECNVLVSFVVVPGNHDCNFRNNNKSRDLIISGLAKEGAEIDESVIGICTSVQNEFFEFRKLIEDDGCEIDDGLWRSKLYDIGGKSIRFECLNMAWMSKKVEEQGGICFPYERYEQEVRNEVDIRISLLHHPVNWLSQSSYRPLRKFLREISNVVITGHEHVGCFGENEDTESSISTYVEGCPLWTGRIEESSFNSILIDLNEFKYKAVKYSFDKKNDTFWASEDGSWLDYRDLPSKKDIAFAIDENFIEALEDAGANFRHSGKQKVLLSDIFIYPDMRLINDDDDKEIISSKHFLNIDNICDGVVIEGGEKSGASSLIFRLYSSYHDCGFVPLLLKGSDLKKAADVNLDEWLKSAVNEQYGSDAIVPFFQLEAAGRVLFIDDFDEMRIKDKGSKNNIIAYMKKRFRAVVLVVGDMFDLKEMLETKDEVNPVSRFVHYRLQYFGYLLRSKLINRWCGLGNDGSMDEAEVIAYCDNAERMIDAVMAKNIIPASPFYLLTLLQSLEVGRAGDFKDSALGYYYEYLLTDALTSAGLRADKLTEMFDYCAQLSWFFTQKNAYEISTVEFIDFNKEFSEKWHTVDATSRLKLLQDGNIFKKRGEYFSFKYPYIFHYLKGLYLSKNIRKKEIRDYVVRCCRHLYVRDNANTVLFLAHHCSDQFIIEAITEVLNGLFEKFDPVSFDGDTNEISKLIGDAPRLKYSGQAPSEAREQVNNAKDRMDDGQDGLSDSEEQGDQLSLLAELTVLFKTVEILGQILKNQYSGIERERKTELLGCLIEGPLRSLQNFYKYFTDNPDYLVSEIDASLTKKHKIHDCEERKRIANKIVADIIQFTTFGFIMKTARAVSSGALAEDIHAVVRKKDTTAFKLIELSYLLDSPKAIPREYIKSLSQATKGNMISEVLVGMFALNHLYMFKTSEQDKQFLDSVLGLGMGTQRAVDFKTRKTKKLA